MLAGSAILWVGTWHRACGSCEWVNSVGTIRIGFFRGRISDLARVGGKNASLGELFRASDARGMTYGR